MLKILIVEDNISFANAIELMLRRKYRGVGAVLVQAAKTEGTRSKVSPAIAASRHFTEEVRWL